MKKLYRLYLALALFVLATGALELFLQRRVTRTYATSIAASQRFMARRTALDGLDQLAAAINAPGNDVFDDAAVDLQSEKMEVSIVRFERALRSERQRILLSEPAAEQTVQLRELAEVEPPMRALIAEGRAVFPALKEGRTADAGAHMARMDRAYSVVRKELAKIDAQLRGMQESAFHLQARSVSFANNLTYLIIRAARSAR